MASIYLLCIDPPYKHARHYIGFTEDDNPARRVNEHVSCSAKGTSLIRAAVQAGHTIHHALTIPNGSRTLERRLKNRKDTPRWCPLCAQRQPRVKLIAEACDAQS